MTGYEASGSYVWTQTGTANGTSGPLGSESLGASAAEAEARRAIPAGAQAVGSPWSTCGEYTDVEPGWYCDGYIDWERQGNLSGSGSGATEAAARAAALADASSGAPSGAIVTENLVRTTAVETVVTTYVVELGVWWERDLF